MMGSFLFFQSQQGIPTILLFCIISHWFSSMKKSLSLGSGRVEQILTTIAHTLLLQYWTRLGRQFHIGCFLVATFCAGAGRNPRGILLIVPLIAVTVPSSLTNSTTHMFGSPSLSLANLFAIETFKAIAAHRRIK
jgi:hypothetical protein